MFNGEIRTWQGRKRKKNYPVQSQKPDSLSYHFPPNLCAGPYHAWLLVKGVITNKRAQTLPSMYSWKHRVSVGQILQTPYTQQDTKKGSE